MLQYILLCLTSLLTMINPLAVMAVYSGITADLDRRHARRIALRACLIASAILVAFALTGELIFDFFAISVHSLRVVGGVLFFIMGYEMVQARLASMPHVPRKEAGPSLDGASKDVALTPIAMPMISGPGTIATVIILMHQGTNLTQKSLLVVTVLFSCLLTFLLLLGAQPIMRRLGEQGNKMLTRIMGLIVMVIAVEFFFSGLTPIVREMLHLPLK